MSVHEESNWDAHELAHLERCVCPGGDDLACAVLSSVAVLRFVAAKDALAVAGLNRRMQVAFLHGCYDSEVTLPCFDTVTFHTSPLAPSRTLVAVLQQLRCAVFAFGGTGYGGTGGGSSGVTALKQVLAIAHRLQSVKIVRPTVALLKRLALVVPAGPLTELSLGRAGHSNTVITDDTLAQLLATVGPRLMSLALVKLNGLTCDSLHSIAEHCSPRLRRLTLVSCAQVCATSAAAPQGAEHMFHALGPHVTDWDVRFSLDMCDRWLGQLAEVRRRAQALAIAASALPALRTFVASRMTPNDDHSGREGAALTSPAWRAFTAEFQAASLLYVDCVGQEGVGARADAPPFLHEGLRVGTSSGSVSVAGGTGGPCGVGDEQSLRSDTIHEAVDDAATSLRAHVVVRPLNRELFSRPAGPPVAEAEAEVRARRRPGGAGRRRCMPYPSFFANLCLPLGESGGGASGCIGSGGGGGMYAYDDEAMDEGGCGYGNSDDSDSDGDGESDDIELLLALAAAGGCSKKADGADGALIDYCAPFSRPSPMRLRTR